MSFYVIKTDKYRDQVSIFGENNFKVGVIKDKLELVS